MVAVTLLVALVLWFTLTSPSPHVPQPAAPTAENVGAGRAAYWQLREARGNAAGVPVSLTREQLAGLGAVASHGFRPDRLRLTTAGPRLKIEASHRLPAGRWLNVTALVEGPSKDFPEVRLKIGSWDLPAFLSRPLIEIGRWYVKRRAPVPPLDRLVRNFSVTGGTVHARISLPDRMGLIDQMAGAVAQPIDQAQVARIYCTLSAIQRRSPSTDFPVQLRRAFSIDRAGADRAGFNRAAFIALGMFVVNERVGELAELSTEDVRRCGGSRIPATLYGRFDITKHWALSAAIAAGAGVQLSEAAGEWKELADSLARGSRFAAGDPSGFSMVDLAADRAGFQVAQAAVQAGSAARVAQALATATPGQILPQQLLQREDGLSNAEFVRRYGSVDDPRFKARVAQIDAVLARTGLR
jgi:hypothetical protein